jgi:hypothetical protein
MLTNRLIESLEGLNEIQINFIVVWTPVTVLLVHLQFYLVSTYEASLVEAGY